MAAADRTEGGQVAGVGRLIYNGTGYRRKGCREPKETVIPGVALFHLSIAQKKHEKIY
jgi:hypothetical protein